MSNPVPNILKIRRRLCFSIAEHLESVFQLGSKEECWDIDQATSLIDSLLPSTRDESILEAEEFDSYIKRTFVPKNDGPSLVDRLKDSLNLDRKTPLNMVLEAAIEHIYRNNAL